MKSKAKLSATSKIKQDSRESKWPEIPLNCLDLPIGVFISIVCEKVERPIHWEDIFSEYLKLTGGSSNNVLLELAKAATIFKNTSFAIQALCIVVSFDQSTEGADEANALLREITRINGKGKMTKQELQRHKNVGNSYKLKAEEKEDEIKALTAKSEVSTQEDWYGQLSLLAKYQGHRINPDKVSTFEYISILNNFKRENKPKPQKRNGR